MACPTVKETHRQARTRLTRNAEDRWSGTHEVDAIAASSATGAKMNTSTGLHHRESGVFITEPGCLPSNRDTTRPAITRPSSTCWRRCGLSGEGWRRRRVKGYVELEPDRDQVQEERLVQATLG
jgi:hypothetical protein